MNNKIQTIDKEIAEKLSGLRTGQTTKDLLQGLREQEKVDKALLVLLDTSGSMNDALEMDRKIDAAWQVFRSQLMPNMAMWNHGIVGFNNEAYWISYPMQTTQLATQAPYATGSTSMGQALHFAWIWIKGHAKEARIVLLSDGMPTDISKANILDMARENSGIPIDTVGIGDGTFTYDPIFLQELSRITGGMFQGVSSVAQLIDTVKKLSPQERPLLGTVHKKEASNGA